MVYGDTPLAQYRVRYQPDAHHFRTVAEPQLFDTIYHSAQMPLWEIDDAQWLKVIRIPPPLPHQRARLAAWQPLLPLIAS